MMFELVPGLSRTRSQGYAMIFIVFSSCDETSTVTPFTPAQVVHDVVKEYGQLAAHDLRLTFAMLAHKGGVGLNQIQLSLGHASIKTTERYLSVTQNLTDAPCDHLGLILE